MNDQNKRINIAQTLPQSLRNYISEQDYAAYTSRDHAVWRYILRQSRAFFKDHAHSVYAEGLKKTGVPINRIPRVSEMDEKLSKYGWRAVCVNGFIPPTVFLEFQARQILPIAVEIRRFENIAYTPAPDIVHEAAGHAPFIVDKNYSEYLRKYGLIAKKAIASAQDNALYEAIRYLSDIKENPLSSAAVIKDATSKLEAAIEKNTDVSEASLVSRLYWWSAEYGLIREDGALKIYGAGLLSSVGESQSCLQDSVEKKKISLDCIDYAFNITSRQPQLFVADDFESLGDLVDQLAAQMAFNIGGAESLEKAQKAQTVNTIELDSGLQISGILDKYESCFKESSSKDVAFFKMRGEVQLCFSDKELKAQGIEQHREGYSSPLGYWTAYAEKLPHLLTDLELAKIGIEVGREAVLEFRSGFVISGRVKSVLREKEHLILITWGNCRVEKDSTIYFEPEWGDFDMAVATEVVSVYSGAADQENYGEVDWAQASSKPGIRPELTAKNVRLFELYQKLRDLREDVQLIIENGDEVDWVLNFEKWFSIGKQVIEVYSEQWLLALELVEFYKRYLKTQLDQQNEKKAERLLINIERDCLKRDEYSEHINRCIVDGLGLL